MAADENLPLDEWLRATLLDAYGPFSETWAREQVERINRRLHAVRRGLPELAIEILWITEVSAFTAPGRYIYLSRRLQERCASDEPVAFVLAHEMAHHDLRHLDLFEGWTARLPRVGGSRLIAAAFRQIERRVYGPEQELEADARALEVCLAAGYDGNRCLQLFDILESDALDRRDLDGVFGPEEDDEPPTDTVDEWIQRARRWTWQRFRGYLPIRERKAALRARLG